MNNNSILKNLLTDLPIFNHLTDDEFRNLAFIGRRQEHEPEEILYGSNNICDGAILMSAGRAMVQFVGINRPSIWVRRGMLIHELSLFTDKIYQHNIIAMESITTYHFEREEFMQLMQDFPEIGQKIQGNIIEKMAGLGASVTV